MGIGSGNVIVVFAVYPKGWGRMVVVQRASIKDRISLALLSCARPACVAPCHAHVTIPLFTLVPPSTNCCECESGIGWVPDTQPFRARTAAIELISSLTGVLVSKALISGLAFLIILSRIHASLSLLNNPCPCAHCIFCASPNYATLDSLWGLSHLLIGCEEERV